jgi:hypothetical protein
MFINSKYKPDKLVTLTHEKYMSNIDNKNNCIL